MHECAEVINALLESTEIRIADYRTLWFGSCGFRRYLDLGIRTLRYQTFWGWFLPVFGESILGVQVWVVGCRKP